MALDVGVETDTVPWGMRQYWALRDNTPKYFVEGTRYVLWRTMAKEVTELSGFDPETLRAKWLQILHSADPDADEEGTPFPRDAYLPPGTSALEARGLFRNPAYLYQWTLEADGSLTGRVRDHASLEDGSVIRTRRCTNDFESLLNCGYARVGDGDGPGSFNAGMAMGMEMGMEMGAAGAEAVVGGPPGSPEAEATGPAGSTADGSKSANPEGEHAAAVAASAAVLPALAVGDDVIFELGDPKRVLLDSDAG